jgi:two-component system, NarL family, nitrate/nitrite response regulator NarL
VQRSTQAKPVDPLARAIRAVIVDDHRLFGDALGYALEACDVVVVQVVWKADEAVAAVRSHRPDAVLLDLWLGETSGLELGREIIEIHPEVSVLAVTEWSDPLAVRRVIEAGFSGYLTKDLAISTFVEALKAACAGNVVVPRETGNGRKPRLEVQRQLDLLVGQLTPRERGVLALLAEGANSEDISKRLHISRNTVRTHTQNVLSKLQVHSRLEAAAFAVRHGLVDTQVKGRTIHGSLQAAEKITRTS